MKTMERSWRGKMRGTKAQCERRRVRWDGKRENDQLKIIRIPKRWDKDKARDGGLKWDWRGTKEAEQNGGGDETIEKMNN